MWSGNICQTRSGNWGRACARRHFGTGAINGTVQYPIQFLKNLHLRVLICTCTFGCGPSMIQTHRRGMGIAHDILAIRGNFESKAVHDLAAAICPQWDMHSRLWNQSTISGLCRRAAVRFRSRMKRRSICADYTTRLRGQREYFIPVAEAAADGRCVFGVWTELWKPKRFLIAEHPSSAFLVEPAGVIPDPDHHYDGAGRIVPDIATAGVHSRLSFTNRFVFLRCPYFLQYSLGLHLCAVLTYVCGLYKIISTKRLA